MKITSFNKNFSYPINSTDIFGKFFENIERIQSIYYKKQTTYYELKSAEMFMLMQNYLETSYHRSMLEKLNSTYNFGISPGAN